MTFPASLEGRLRLPAIVAPMFLASGTDLVVETCRSGLIGTFPALNQRSNEGYRDWLDEIAGRLGALPYAAPFGVNLVVRASNQRLDQDLATTVDKRVPVVITSLGAVREVVAAVHSYGGLIFHDVVNRRHAEKAAEAGVDGIVAVAAGAGGHGGQLSPFALVDEIRSFFDGAIIVSGAIAHGRQIAAVRAMGADMAYLGTRFIATQEAMVEQAYKDMLLAARAADILYTPRVSGINANFLRPSLVAAGLDPENLPDPGTGEAKAWKTLWSAGQGVGGIADIPPAAALCERLIAEYRAAIVQARRDPFVPETLPETSELVA